MKIHFTELCHKEHWAWVTSHLPLHLVEDMVGVLAVNADTREILGAVIMDNWTKTSVQAHIISTCKAVLKYGLLERALGFMFDDKKMLYVIGLVPSSNEKSLKLCDKIGFKEIARIPEAIDVGVDTVVLTLAREDCNYLPQKERAYG